MNKKTKMLQIWALVFLLMIAASVSLAEFSVKERLQMHREWLERRAALKSYPFDDNSTIGKTSYFLKLMKMKNANEIAKQPEENLTDDSQRASNSIYTKEVNQIHPTLIEPDIQNSWTTTTLTNPVTTTIATTSDDALITVLATVDAEANNSILLNEKNNFTTENISTVRLNNVTKTSKRIHVQRFPRWGKWTEWTQCSRTCGEGVKFQERKCIIRKRTNPAKHIISKDCVGLHKRYRLCNIQVCSENEPSFYQQQCSNFDSHLFQGRNYKWEPYIKDDAECELNCKPIDMKYFATLNETVIDGTPCLRPAEYYRKNYRGKAVCVGGICKAIHRNGIITGSFFNNGAVQCGGLLCRPVSGIFTKTPLPSGYVSVAVIPAGASNISITEVKNSQNYLVLKSSNGKFVINGDYSISPSGVYETAGTIFDYRRIEGLNEKNFEIEGVTEWITSLGPTSESIHLMTLGQDTNPGIKYEYLLPIVSNMESDEEILESNATIDEEAVLDSTTENKFTLKSADIIHESSSHRSIERRKRKFIWKVVGFSTCSKSCGGGVQNPIWRCIRETQTRFFSSRRCANIEKPELNENLLRCNTQPCPAYWRVDDWGECICYKGYNHKEREVRCVQELAAGVVIQVNHAACMEEEPLTKKKCECSKGNNRKRNNHIQHFDKQRIHAHARSHDAILNNNLTKSSTVSQFESDKLGIWLTSDWNQHCSAECGNGVEYRSIFCDRSPPNTERCDLRFTPDDTRPCENEKKCESGEWFIGSWGQCNGDCFNLTKSREIFCIKKKVIVDDEECKITERPHSIENCSINDVDYCKPRWHYSAWTDCTKLCDGGTQRRSIKCLEFDAHEKILRISQNCRYSERQPIYRGCNTHKCQEPRVDLIQNDIAPTCIDEFSNCHLVVKANFCNHDYYKQNCCYSCNGWKSNTY